MKLLLLLVLNCWAGGETVPIESLDKPGALQAMQQAFDDKFSLRGGSVTGTVVFQSSVSIFGPLAVSGSASITGNLNVLTGSKVQENGYSLVPTGAIILWDSSSSCPSGYSEVTALRGRYAVGMPSGGTLAAAVGDDLTNMEERPAGQHTHTVTGQNTGGTYTLAFGSDLYANAGASDPGPLVAGTNAPYYQLLFCRKN